MWWDLGSNPAGTPNSLAKKVSSWGFLGGVIFFFIYRFLLYLVKFGALRCSAYEKYLPELLIKVIMRGTWELKLVGHG